MNTHPTSIVALHVARWLNAEVTLQIHLPTIHIQTRPFIVIWWLKFHEFEKMIPGNWNDSSQDAGWRSQGNDWTRNCRRDYGHLRSLMAWMLGIPMTWLQHSMMPCVKGVVPAHTKNQAGYGCRRKVKTSWPNEEPQDARGQMLCGLPAWQSISFHTTSPQRDKPTLEIFQSENSL